jgi:DNA-directed RNA polymerase specialized sigma24 family protein
MPVEEHHETALNLLSDEELVFVTQEGFRASNVLLERYRTPIQMQAAHLHKALHLPEVADTQQEAMVAFCKALHRYDRARCGSFAPFLRRVLLTHLIDVSRVEGRHREHTKGTLDIDAVEGTGTIKKVAGHQRADPAHTNPLLLAELEEFWEILARLAAHLGPPTPAILTAVRGGAKLVEVARELDLDVSVVAGRWHKFLEEVAKRFRERPGSSLSWLARE